MVGGNGQAQPALELNDQDLQAPYHCSNENLANLVKNKRVLKHINVHNLALNQEIRATSSRLSLLCII